MSARWSPVVKIIVVIGMLLLAIWLLFRFDALLVPLVTALIVAYLLNLPVGLLTRRTGLSRTMATIVVFLIVVLLLILIPALFGPRIVSEAASLEIDVAVRQALERFAAQPIEILTLRIDPQSVLDQIQAALGGLMSPAVSSAFTLVANTAQAIGWLIFVLVVAFLLVKDVSYFTRLISERIPASLAPDAYRLGGELGAIWNAFLRGRFILSVVVSIVATVVLTAIGMRNALALGVLTGALTFIPSVGPFLAGMVVALLALVNGSTYLPLSNLGFTLLVAGLYFAMFQIESMYLQPSIIGRHVRLHPLVVIVGTVGGALMAGILGIFLAAPVIASARVLFSYTYYKLLDQDPFPDTEEKVEVLSMAWPGYIRGRAIEAILFDLDGTLVETDDRMVERVAERLARFRRILPGHDPVHAARRLVMASENWMSGLLAMLDRVGWDQAAQRLGRRLQIIEDRAQGWQPSPVAGALDLFGKLNGRYQVGIVSSRREAEIVAFLNQHALNGQVQVIAGFDTTERIKPHPQPVLWAAARLGVDPANVAVVGDTAVDVRAAKAAGALAIGVLCGFGDDQDLAQADVILDTTADLANLL